MLRNLKEMYRLHESDTLPTISAFVGFIAFTRRAASACYYSNGVIAQSPTYQPCNSIGGTTTMCCASNRTNPLGGDGVNGQTADQCLPNGLCLNVVKWRDNDGEWRTNTSYWRNECTSSNWMDSGCLDICTSITVRNHDSILFFKNIT